MDEFYRVPFSSGEARAVLAALHVTRALAAKAAPADAGELDADILDSALARFASEVPDFVVSQAAKAAQDFLAGFKQESSPPVLSGERIVSAEHARRLLEDAYERELPVQIEYYVRSRNEWTTRRVDITDLSPSGEDGAWLLEGYCSLRADTRYFRLEYIRSVRVLDADDETPDPFAE